MSGSELVSPSPLAGFIFNIQRFSLHDGPGIRTTVFLKGCPLCCAWCSNPESQDFSPNLMVRELNCKRCGKCQPACSRGAIKMAGEGRRIIDWERCDHCLECVITCRYGSLNKSGEKNNVEDVLQEICKDRHFYNNSGGGLTLSGGEPLCQADFAAALLEKSKTEGIHTAVDTSGHVPWEAFQKVIPHTDLFLFDLKHLDPEEHKRATGADNSLIKQNINQLTGRCKVWLRIPLIPNFNDAEGHLQALAELACRNQIEKVSLLPYHEGGKSKMLQMGRSCSMPEIMPSSEDSARRAKTIMEEKGLTVSVGS